MSKRNKKQKSEKHMPRPHVNVGTIGHVDHGKSTVASSVNIALAIRYSRPFMNHDEIETSHIEYK